MGVRTPKKSGLSLELRIYGNRAQEVPKRSKYLYFVEYDMMRCVRGYVLMGDTWRRELFEKRDTCVCVLTLDLFGC